MDPAAVGGAPSRPTAGSAPACLDLAPGACIPPV